MHSGIETDICTPVTHPVTLMSNIWNTSMIKLFGSWTRVISWLSLSLSPLTVRTCVPAQKENIDKFFEGAIEAQSPFWKSSLPKTAARIAHLQASLIIANVSICFRSISLSVTVLQTSKFSKVSFETMGTWPPLDLEVCIVDVPTLYALEVRVMRSQSSAQAVMVTGYSFSVAWYVFGSVLPGPPWDVYGIYCNYMFFFVCHYDVIAIFKLRMLSFGWKEVVCCCSCLAASPGPHPTTQSW